MIKKMFFCLFLLLILNLGVVSAETTDKTPPVINSFEFVNNEFISGDIVKLKADIEDDISGFETAHFIFIEDGTYVFTNENNYQISFQSLMMQDGYMIAESHAVKKETTYKLLSISLSDKAGNTICYTTTNATDSSVDGCTKILDEIKITVKPNNVESGFKSLKINKNEFDVGEKIKFEVEVNNPEEVNQINIFYRHENISNNTDTVILERLGDTNTYTGELELKYAGKYYLDNLCITFNNRLSEVYAYKSLEIGTSGNLYKIFEDGIYDSMVNGEVIEDTELPEFVSLKVEKDKIQAPGFIKIKVNAKDNVSVKSVFLGYTEAKEFEKSPDQITQNGVSCNAISDGEFECIIEFNQYAKPSIYKVREIQISDNAGNMSAYYYGGLGDWINYDEPQKFGSGYMAYKKLPEYSFQIEKNVNADETTSTISNKLLDKINKASDNATISIDCTSDPIIKKEVFDAIKGTNKTISIETNGIQWIFNGKNIIQETKDINVSSNIGVINTTDNKILNIIFKKTSLINISFYSNGLLPGIAKIRVKADYTFRNIVGTKNLFVFYLDKSNNKVRYISKLLNMTEDGYYEFFIAHNSEYLITSEEPKVEHINTTKVDQKVENINNGVNNNTVNNKPDEETNIDNKVDKEDSSSDNEINKEDTTIDIVEDEFESSDIETDLKDNEVKNESKKVKNNSVFKVLIISIIVIVVLVIVGIIIYKNKFKSKSNIKDKINN